MFKYLNSVAASFVFFAAASFFASNAYAEVLVCNGCSSTQYKSSASAAGAGTHLVADFPQRTLTAWEVEYDREFRVWRTLPIAVPQSIMDSFLFDMERLSSPQSINRAKTDGGSEITVGPGITGGPFDFPSDLTGVNAYDVVLDASLRGSIESKFAALYSGADTSYETWNNIAYSFKSIALSYTGALFGISSTNIVILWADGSKTVVKVEAGDTRTAKYQQGKSVDSEGNRIADAAASDGQTGGGYSGFYEFNSPDTLQQWVDAARLNGVQITGPSSTQQKEMVCSWDGQTLTCNIY